MYRFSLVVSFIFIQFGIFSQDKLLMMSGREISVIVDTIQDDQIHFTILKKGKDKQNVLDLDEVFSFTRFNESETVIYEIDKAYGRDFTVEEQRHFIFGEQDARKGFPTKWTSVGGFAAGLGGTFILDTGAIPFLIPVAYSLGMQIPIVKVAPSSISDEKYKNFDSYIQGYEKTARSKKFVASFVSSLAGVALGTAVIELTR